MEPLRLCDHEMGIKVIRDQPSFLRREGKTNFCVRTEKKRTPGPALVGTNAKRVHLISS